jgi:arylsulfatase
MSNQIVWDYSENDMKPNILLIYTDQQRFDTIGAMGNSIIQTPNIDRLVNEGVAFSHATTPSPVCLANRWSLHSGQWTTTHECYSNHHRGIRPKTDIPAMLSEAGYVTGLSGKNHSFLTADDMDMWDENPSLPDHPEWDAWLNWQESRNQTYPRLAQEPMPTSITAEHAKTATALHFMDEHKDSDQPFFLWLSYLYPHTPFEAPEPYFSMYDNLPSPNIEADGLVNKPFRQQFHQRNNDAIMPFSDEQIRLMRQIYYGMVTMIDGGIGKILDYLDDNNLSDKTLIVFTSDHGDYQGDHGLIAKSPSLYDVLVRVPMICRWTGHIDRGRVDERFASHVDLMPTFADVAGINCPQQAQGVNLMPFLRDGGTGEAIRPFAVCEYGIPDQPYTEQRLIVEGLQDTLYTNPWNDKLSWEGNPIALAGRIRMIRTHDWKYIDEPDGICELYDLNADPHELTNLWNHPDYQEIQTELQMQLKAWKMSISQKEETL